MSEKYEPLSEAELDRLEADMLTFDIPGAEQQRVLSLIATIRACEKKIEKLQEALHWKSFHNGLMRAGTVASAALGEQNNEN